MPAHPLYAADIPPEKDPALEDLHALAAEALAAIPEPFKSNIDGVVIRIAEWPEDEVLEDMGFESPYDLLGLYHGVPYPHRSPACYGNYPPDVIVIYQRPIESISRSDEEIKDHVRDTVLHEVGHYFGLSEAELREIERAVREQRKGGSS